MPPKKILKSVYFGFWNISLQKVFICSIIFLFGISFHVRAQVASVSGYVKDSLGRPIEDAGVGYIGGKDIILTNSNGFFIFSVPADKPVMIVVHINGYNEFREEIRVPEGKVFEMNIEMKRNSHLFKEDTIVAKSQPEILHRKDFEHVPGNPMDIKSFLIFNGATSSNEFSNQYSVRGGNFDENLVYVNGVEVYRPFLTRSGQQEGLSFVNLDMIDDKLFFSAGGFEAKYGDKMSSVLDIHYRIPHKFGGTASASLLGFSAEVEGCSSNYRFTWMIGIRNKSNRYLLRSLDTKGDYKTNFTDIQTFLTYNFTDKWSLDYLGSYGQNNYNLIPSTRETDFGTLNNALRFTVYFDGQEVNHFSTIFNALSLNYDDHIRWKTKFILSSFNTYESETYDVQGQYYIDQLETDFGKPTFGQVAFNRGVGTFLNHARNYLNAWVNSAEIKTTRTGNNFIWQFGARVQNEQITDELREWNMVDSAGYSIPYLPTSTINLQDVVISKGKLFSNRVMGFAQVKYFKTLKDSSEISVVFGVRANYWDLNNQIVVSPRAQINWKPHTKRDLTFKLAGGLYDQPPFYRELRGFDGVINRSVKAQTSVHAVAGADLSFKAWGRPFRFITEGYYKYLDNLIPYEVDDVRIRYYGQNLSHGYTYGLDLKLNGEFVKGVDSWVNLSLLRTREDLYNDVYYIRRNAEGDTIIPGYTFDQHAVDSIAVYPGYIPRPTDQLFTFSLYFQDYLPALPDCKMNLGLILGSGLPFGPPTHERYKAVFRMPPYRRVDIGFSYQIIKEEKPLKKENPFHFMKSLWVGLEVYNLLQVQNTLSYYWVKDVTGRSYAIPNYLTNRQLSARIIIHF